MIGCVLRICFFCSSFCFYRDHGKARLLSRACLMSTVYLNGGHGHVCTVRMYTFRHSFVALTICNSVHQHGNVLYCAEPRIRIPTPYRRTQYAVCRYPSMKSR
jgi:hypothetical protein